MKILLVTDGLPPETLGGAGRIVCETAMELSRRGHEVWILGACLRPPHLDGVTIIPLKPLPRRTAHWRAVFGSKRSKEILTIIHEIQPDIIHAHATAWQCGYRFLSDATKEGYQCIFTSHDAMTVAYGKVREDDGSPPLLSALVQGGFPFRNFFVRRCLLACRKRLSVSNALRSFLETHGIPALDTLHNGIDTNFWSPIAQQKARAKLGISLDQTVFLLAGRIGVDKGSTLVASALPKKAMLLVIGTSGHNEFRASNGTVRFIDQASAEEMHTYYAACDAALAPSRYLDPFPTVCLEAMAMERPVIATNQGGAKEAVVDQKTGWVIDPTDAAAWAERLQWCTQHREDLMQIGKEARTHVEKHFSLDAHIDALLKIYDNCQQKTKRV